MIATEIAALLIGQPRPFRAGGTQSAIARETIDRPVMLRKLGFEGDQVADPTAHGGVDKAVHLYPAEHYPCWQAYFKQEGLGPHPYLGAAGAFGENISASGLTEEKVKIGDRFRIGKAVVEVSQGRQPCWKIDHHFGVPGLSGAVIKTGRCGLYFRVIEEGEVAPLDRIEQVEAADHEWTIERTFKLLVGGGHKVADATSDLLELAALDTLAVTWRQRATKLAAL